MAIYQPEEDSYLLSETLKEFFKNKQKTIKILDLGSGSGILAETCRKLGFKNILTSDINPESVKILKEKKFDAVQSDLFSNLGKRKGDLSGEPGVPIRFDLIIFNPPYLPTDENEPVDSRLETTGGKKGYEIILKFLDESRSHLNKNGEILLLISSLTKPRIIKQKAKELGYKIKILNKKKIFFEELFVLLINN
jgi:release factor glutamine methyltransferase